MFIILTQISSASHNHKKEHVCLVCNKAYTWNWELVKHMEKHKAIKVEESELFKLAIDLNTSDRKMLQILKNLRKCAHF